MPEWIELRTALDGECYTKAEILEHYGSHGQIIWDQLPRATEYHRQRREASLISQNPGWTVTNGIWQRITPAVVAATSSRNIDAHQLDAPRNSDAPVIPTTVSSRNIDAPQLDASENSDALALMPHAAADALALMPPVVLTCDQLKAMPHVSAHQGKFACEKQRELRAELLTSGTYEHDLTHSDWPWRDVIRSLPKELHKILVGPGVTMFTFKLVRNEIDPNYAQMRNDSGERHVFHIRRTDNVAHHLHYHKDGSLDDPAKSRHTITVQNTSPGNPIIRQEHFTSVDYGALQPVGFDMRSIVPGPNVGRKEAASACTTLLEVCGFPGVPVSVDVTDELAFPWRRWLLHQPYNITGPNLTPHNIVKVFICRGLLVRDEAMIACCRVDGTYVCFYPTANKPGRRAVIRPGWLAVILFQDPYFVALPWNRIPDRA